MNWQALIFDRDGTLFQSLPVILRAFNHGVEPFVKKLPTDQEWFKAFGPAEEEVMAVFIRKEHRKEAFQRYLNYYQTHMDQIQLYPEMFDLLKEASEAGMKLALFTGGGRESTAFCMEKEGILKYFQVLITGDDVMRPKPHPEGILKVINELKLTANRTLVIGDAGADMIAGKAAGAATVLARWGSHELPFDLQSQSDYVFYSVEDFREFVFQG
jgi:HAD superfamily hydrolase (TIGR01509 family)